MWAIYFTLKCTVKHQLRNTPDEQACIFCAQTSCTMHLCSTMRLDHELHKMMEELQDTIMSMIAGGDLIAIDANIMLIALHPDTKFS